MRVGWLAFALLMTLTSGCFGGSDDPELASGSAAVPLPILTLSIRVGNDTFEFTSAPAIPRLADAAVANQTSSASGNSTAPADNSTAGNATDGNTTSNATADGNETAAAADVPTGLAPLEVTFSIGVLNATGGFNWTLLAGDEDLVPAANATDGNATGNATSDGNATADANATAGANATAPAMGTTGNTSTSTITHVYETAGEFTPTLTLELANGTKILLEAKLMVLEVANSTGAGAVAGVEVGTAVFDQSGTFTVAVQGTSCGQGISASLTYDWEIPGVGPAGEAVQANKVVLRITPGTTAVDVAIQFLDPDGASIKNTDDGFTGAETLTAEGDFPAGIYKVRAYACTAVDGDFDVHGEATLVTI